MDNIKILVGNDNKLFTFKNNNWLLVTGTLTENNIINNGFPYYTLIGINKWNYFNSEIELYVFNTTESSIEINTIYCNEIDLNKPKLDISSFYISEDILKNDAIFIETKTKEEIQYDLSLDISSFYISEDILKNDDMFIETKTKEVGTAETLSLNVFSMINDYSNVSNGIQVVGDQYSHVRYAISADNGMTFYTHDGIDWIEVDKNFIWKYGLSQEEISKHATTSFIEVLGRELYTKDLIIGVGLLKRNGNVDVFTTTIEAVFEDNKHPEIHNIKMTPDIITNEGTKVMADIKDYEGDKIYYRILIQNTGNHNDSLEDETYKVYKDWVDIDDVSHKVIQSFENSDFTPGDNSVIIQVKDSRGVIGYERTNLKIHNTEPFGVTELSNEFRSTFIIDDRERNMVRYKILLNGVEQTEFSEFRQTPFSITYDYNQSDILIGKHNTGTAILEDQHGVIGEYGFYFIGEYKNILFYDENGELYTDHRGNMLKPLDIGTIYDNNESEIRKIIIENNTGYSLADVEVGANTADSVVLYMCESRDNFIPKRSINIVGNMSVKERREIYFKIVNEGTRGISPGDIRLYATGKILR